MGPILWSNMATITGERLDCEHQDDHWECEVVTGTGDSTMFGADEVRVDGDTRVYSDGSLYVSGGITCETRMIGAMGQRSLTADCTQD